MTRTRAQRRTPPGPARTHVHVESRPFPGAEPPTAEAATSVADVLADARASLTNAHEPGCQCSAWCRDDWTYAEHGAPAFGPCSACGELCRSIDPQGRLRHPNCVPVVSSAR